MPDLSSAAGTPFNQPWLNEKSVIIIDAYADNSINWEEMKTDSKVVAVIHKATEGLKGDSKYHERSKQAKENGYLFGSYHLATSEDVKQQADQYLEVIGEESIALMALDLESLDDKHMSLKDAELFIKYIHERTGRYPYIYCNNDVFSSINEQYFDTSTFAKCHLWYARFRKEIPEWNSKIWRTYTLWQFSCELNCSKTGECLYNVAGTKYDINVNVFNGSIDELKKVWNA